MQPKQPVKQHPKHAQRECGMGREGVYEGGKEGIESERIQNRNGSENKKIKKTKKSRPHQTEAILYSSSFPLGKERCAERGLASRGRARGRKILAVVPPVTGVGVGISSKAEGCSYHTYKMEGTHSCPSHRLGLRRGRSHMKIYKTTLKMETATSKCHILSVPFQSVYPTCLKLLCFFCSSESIMLTLRHRRQCSESFHCQVTRHFILSKEVKPWTLLCHQFAKMKTV